MGINTKLNFLKQNFGWENCLCDAAGLHNPSSENNAIYYIISIMMQPWAKRYAFQIAWQDWIELREYLAKLPQFNFRIKQTIIYLTLNAENWKMYVNDLLIFI